MAKYFISVMLLCIMLPTTSGDVLPPPGGEIDTLNGYNYIYLEGFVPTQQISRYIEEGYVVFKVRTKHDAHIILSDEGKADVYEIVIGGWGNTKSCLRNTKQQNPCLAEVKHQGPVSEHESRSFWIHWSDRLIRVGAGSRVGEGEFMRFEAVQQVPAISHIGVGSWEVTSPGYWQFIPVSAEIEIVKMCTVWEAEKSIKGIELVEFSFTDLEEIIGKAGKKDEEDRKQERSKKGKSKKRKSEKRGSKESSKEGSKEGSKKGSKEDSEEVPSVMEDGMVSFGHVKCNFAAKLVKPEDCEIVLECAYRDSHQTEFKCTSDDADFCGILPLIFCDIVKGPPDMSADDQL